MSARSILATLGSLLLGSCASAIEAEFVASGTIEATQADLAFQIPGRLAALEAREGDRVVRGALLGVLDTSEVAARARSAEAQVAAARAALRELEAGARTQELAQARLMLDAAEERLRRQARDTERTVRLAEGGAASREQRDHAESALSVTRAERDRLAEQLALLEAGSRPERVAAQRAMVSQAEAAQAQVQAILGQMRLVAPFDGIVTVRHREPGEVVAPGAPVLSVIDPTDRWVRVFVPQDRVGRLAPGQAVDFVTDAFPDRTYRGEVAAIATEAEFTPRNVQTTEERVKLVYAVRVRVVGDSALEVKPGLAADVRFTLPPA